MNTKHDVRRGFWILLVLALATGLAPGEAAAQFDVCGCEGSPSLGDFDSADQSTWPTGTTWSGSSNAYIGIPLPEDGVLVFDSFTVGNTPPGYNSQVYFRRNAANTPVTLLVKGDVNVYSGDVINLIGNGGGDANSSVAGKGGRPGVGGFAGGDGAYQLGNLAADGGAGIGPGGGLGANATDAAQGGTFVGVPELRPLVGGSGGGGGRSSSAASNCSGGGGGAGGGAILIAANGTINVANGGTINADGGFGGNRASSTCDSSGGGGSGGAIRLVADTITGTGWLYARGGSGSAAPSGGTGSPGLIRMEALTNNFGVNTNPVAIRIAAPGPLVNPVTPTVAITNIDGALTPADPQGFLGEIDMIVAAPGSIQMDLETSSVPSGTDVEVTVKPKVGADPIVERVTLAAGSCTAGVCQASVLVDLDPGAYIVEARATFEAP